MRAKMANVRNEICKLIIKYGNWGACVATQAGKVIHAGQYVLACRAMGIPARVYRIPNDKAKIAAEFLNKSMENSLMNIWKKRHLFRLSLKNSA